MPASKIITVGEYIASAPAWARPLLRQMRVAICAAAPGVTESISYHMPYYSQHGRLAYVSVAKEHCSFHWVSPADKKLFAKDLASQEIVGQTLHVRRGGKVPVGLIKRLLNRAPRVTKSANSRAGEEKVQI